MNIGSAPVTLGQLTKGIVTHRFDDLPVFGMTLDSRKVRDGDLFLAISGQAVDGRDFINQAYERGAVAVLAETPVKTENDSRTVVAIDELSKYAGLIANRFYNYPSKHIRVVGVTGTNGKTTCCHILAQALNELGSCASVIGTIGNGVLGALRDNSLTTPDVLSVHQELSKNLSEKADVVCMEVSSHALDQNRVDGVLFEVAVFTNLSQDHLDYHHDMTSYGKAKSKLFQIKSLSSCVINIDDVFGCQLSQLIEPELLWTYGVSEQARVRQLLAKVERNHIRIDCRVNGAVVEIKAPLAGAFNVSNVLAVFTTLMAMGYSSKKAVESLLATRPVPGRMELIDVLGKPLVVVDFAHSPDALYNVLKNCRGLTQGKVWVVFGCGGDRDKDKRPQMGAVASQLADHAIITNDNPRYEKPELIAADICAGMNGRQQVCLDRKQAIAQALKNAGKDDLVLIAGKGHETDQDFGSYKQSFSDRAVVAELFELRQ
jgi:UDP-N-acetylmuramoyl-L-alanyl-D-glutamate--2,6-diaminopimelate ligase